MDTRTTKKILHIQKKVGEDAENVTLKMKGKEGQTNNTFRAIAVP